MMISRIKLIAIPLALAAGAAVATPALAQNYTPRQMRLEINHLEDRVEDIGESRRFTNAEYRRMTNTVDALRELYQRYGRDGFSRREIAGLSERIDNVRARINTQAHDGDRLRR